MRSHVVKSLAAFGWFLGALAFDPQDAGYDYIVVGGGPSGIIAAERLAEAGKSVILLERGEGPTVATGSNHTLAWNDTLTQIDLPGLSFNVGASDLWKDYICTDTGGTAACVLGGGVTVNYMVFVHPPERDFDDKWPAGWKWNDVKAAADRLYSRNPGTTLPSADGERYDQELYTIFSSFLSKIGWTSVDMITEPNEKHNVYSYPSWNIQDEKRAGPVRTYLPLAQQLDHFSLRLGAKVTRVLRSGSTITGVEVQTESGAVEAIQLAPQGRVVLAAGALSTPRILFNSGIGPESQIDTANNSGVSVPPRSDWINLPVGVGLKDHPIFSVLVGTNGSFTTLDAASILNGTATVDMDAYEQHNSGVLTQGKHRLIFYTSNVASDNQTRYFQGSCAPTGAGVIEIKVYMTHGLTSTGVLGIDANQNTVIETSPYLQTAEDKEAATLVLQELVDSITAPGTGLELQKYTNVSAMLDSRSSGTHYVGSTKLGLDDGRYNGTSVVDANAKVYGTDNLYIIDAGIHPDLPTGNIQTTVMVVAEAAVERILAEQ